MIRLVKYHAVSGSNYVKLLRATADERAERSEPAPVDMRRGATRGR